MATRKIIDAKHNGEKVWLKGHAQATFMSNGTTVEDAINQIGTGGGGGGIAVETDPIFLASPAASITEAKKTEWDNKMDKVVLSSVATSGNYNDLTNKPTIPASVTESTVSGWGFTKNTGTYSKPTTGIPVSDLAEDIQTSLGKANTALQSYTEQYKGTITGVSANGTSVATSGVANIPAATTSKYGVTKLSSATNSTSTSLAATASAVKAAYDLANGKQEKLTSGTNIKTINGESILGSGDIIISGGSGANVQAVDTGDVIDEVETHTYVQYVSQTLTDEQKTQVRANIDAISGSSLKTINGESIVGVGDITIAGGSSGGGGVETISLSGGFGMALVVDEMLAEKRYWLYVDGDLDGNDQSIVIGSFEGDGVADGTHIRHFYAVIECSSMNEDPFNVSLLLPDVDIRWSTGTPIPIMHDGIVGRYELSITQVIESGYAYYNAVLTSFN